MTVAFLFSALIRIFRVRVAATRVMQAGISSPVAMSLGARRATMIPPVWPSPCRRASLVSCTLEAVWRHAMGSPS